MVGIDRGMNKNLCSFQSKLNQHIPFILQCWFTQLHTTEILNTYTSDNSQHMN
jgi:hypothetical protein